MRYLPSLLRLQILSNDGICLGTNIKKFDQMWYLLHICIDFAVVVNPFFRAVPISPTKKVGKMAIFESKQGVNTFEKISIFRLFELLVFIA